MKSSVLLFAFRAVPEVIRQFFYLFCRSPTHPEQFLSPWGQCGPEVLCLTLSAVSPMYLCRPVSRLLLVHWLPSLDEFCVLPFQRYGGLTDAVIKG